MFRSVSLKDRKRIGISALCAAAFIAVCCVMLCVGDPDTVTIGGKTYSLRMEAQADIAAFLTACGYPDAEPLSETKITVPKNWNKTYTHYNTLQREQGFDLTPYKGETARELRCLAGDTAITLLICDDVVIAAHCCDTDGSSMRALL